jgi:pyruvate formate lyase activating enzyme
MNPGVLESLFCREETRPDYIALDLKLPPERYGELAPQNMPGEAGAALKESAAALRFSGINHEFRTLALPGSCLAPEEISAMAVLVDGAPWYFRTFRPGNCLNPVWDSLAAPGPEAAAALARKARESGKRGIEL